MSSTFSTEGKNSFIAAHNTWNSVFEPYKPTFSKLSTDNSATDYNKNNQNEVFKTNGGNDSYPMLTALYYEDNKLVEFDTRVNTYYPFSNSGASNAFDVQNVATHELGHALFSDDIFSISQTQPQYYNEVSDFTMYGYTDLGETKKRTLHPDDCDGVRAAY